MPALIKISILKDGKFLILTEYGQGQRIMEKNEGFELKDDALLLVALDVIKGALGEKQYVPGD